MPRRPPRCRRRPRHFGEAVEFLTRYSSEATPLIEWSMLNTPPPPLQPAHPAQRGAGGDRRLAARHARQSGKPYWWRTRRRPEIRLTEPPDAWKVGSLDNGDPFLWRSTGDGDQEVQIWRKSFLDSGAPFWWRMTEDGGEDVRLNDPYEERPWAGRGVARRAMIVNFMFHL